MSQVTTNSMTRPETTEEDSQPLVIAFRSSAEGRSALDEIIHRGAQQMLQAAVENEVESFLTQHADRCDEHGRRFVVRNGHLPSREIATGAGMLEVTQPRVRDRSPNVEGRVHFSPAILPPYLRRSKTVDELIPWLYLKGISTGDFSEALSSLLGPDCPGLSPNVVVRLKSQWSEEYDAWCRRDLTGRNYAYIWADGIHVNVRLEDDANKRQCILVIIGATTEGDKELLAVVDGYRESEQSWHEVLMDLKSRGLTIAPQVAVGDGALGFWAALRKIFPKTREQRCWVHKTANVLNKMPKSVQPKAKEDLHEIWMAATRDEANKAFDDFIKKYTPKYGDACQCLSKDRDALLVFYDFPAEHWKHLRTTNPIESTFATIRLRHRKTKGSGTRKASLTMMFKLAENAQKKWRKLNGHEQLTHLIAGRVFKDGILQEAA